MLIASAVALRSCRPSVLARGFRSFGSVAVLGVAAFIVAPALAQPVQWSVLSPESAPAARSSSGLVYDSAQGVSILFGGTIGFAFQNDTWKWDGTTWTQDVFGGPSARSYPGMAFDSVRGVTVLFGGFNGQLNGDTWELGESGWTFIDAPGPSARALHAMAFDSARGVTVLFGGGPDFVANGETWEWDGESWTQRLVSGPPARGYHAMAYDSARGVTVLFGGVDENGADLRDTWEWNGTVWTRRSLGGPSARSVHAMAYDSARGVTVLFGGSTNEGVSNAETWEWNGTTWSRLAGAGPTRRFLHSMAFDSRRGETILFGGSSPAALGDLWRLGVPCVAPSVTTQPLAQAACPGTPVTLGVVAAGSGPFTYQWRRGEPRVEIFGATEQTLVIAAADASDADSYDCVITNTCGSVTSAVAVLTVLGTDDPACAQCDYDYHQDEAVALLDAQQMAQVFVGLLPPESNWLDGDLNGDENADLTDAQILAAFVVSGTCGV